MFINGGGQRHSCNLFREGGKKILNVLCHVKGNSTRCQEIHIHSQIVVDGTSCNIELFIFSIILICKPFEKRRNNSGILMPDKEVVDMPAYRHLEAVDFFVCHARVVGVDSITKNNEIHNQFTVE